MDGELDVYLLEDDAPVVLAGGSGRPFLALSRSVVELLGRDELENVLAHEVGRVSDDTRLMSLILFILRSIMFFNPGTLLVSGSISREKEKMFDDLAVSLAGDPSGLSSAILKMFKVHLSAHRVSARFQGEGFLCSFFHTSKFNLNWKRIDRRVKRLTAEGKPDKVPFEEFRLGLLAGSLAVLLFYVV